MMKMKTAQTHIMNFFLKNNYSNIRGFFFVKNKDNYPSNELQEGLTNLIDPKEYTFPRMNTTKERTILDEDTSQSENEILRIQPHQSLHSPRLQPHNRTPALWNTYALEKDI